MGLTPFIHKIQLLILKKKDPTNASGAKTSSTPLPPPHRTMKVLRTLCNYHTTGSSWSTFFTVTTIILLQAGLESEAAPLPRCPDAVPDGGNDDIVITKVGDSCANMLYSSDLRVIGGLLLTYSTGIADSTDSSSTSCDGTYEQSANFAIVKSGPCQSYYVAENVACLSNCDDAYDCYVSETQQTLEYDTCALAAGIATQDISDNQGANDEDDNDGITCYDYNYSGPGFREDPPEERKCPNPDTQCISYESKNDDLGTTISIGRCAPYDNFCGQTGDDVTICTECDTDLCNPIISYTSSGTYHNSKTFRFRCAPIFALTALFVLLRPF